MTHLLYSQLFFRANSGYATTKSAKHVKLLLQKVRLFITYEVFFERFYFYWRA